MPMFRFSQWVSSKEELLGWLEHFKRAGIPAAIVSRPRSPHYAVVREGREILDRTAKDRYRYVVLGTHRIEREVNRFISKTLNGDRRRDGARNN